MKKFLTALVILTLALAMMTSGLAETVAEINWTDVDIASTGIEGSYYTFEDVAIMVWIPDLFENKDLSEDDVANGVIGKFEVSDGSAGIYAQYIQGNEGATMDELAASLEANGAAEIERCTLNGLDAVSYSIPGVDAVYVAFVTVSGNYVQFMFSPVSDEGFASVAQLITASIQPEQ